MLDFTDKSAPWFAKITGQGRDKQVFIYHHFGGMTQAVICVGLDGYDYNKQYLREPSNQWRKTTRGYNIHFAANGPMQMTWKELRDLNLAIESAQWYLNMDRANA